ncbi:MAG: FkbM family methyltransferase [Gemmatimonadaceae bacterium]
MSLLSTLRFILGHPLNSGSRAQALRRFVAWQLGSRLVPGPVVMEFVNGSRLVVSRGTAAVTGNLYTRLHEFAEMAFVLHAIRAGDLFVDVGANIGAYTVLAASIPGARCAAFEPAPETFERLTENIRLNDFGSRVQANQMAAGSEDGELVFTKGLDSVNHVVGPDDHTKGGTTVRVRRLDTVLHAENPVVMKIDVEGYEMLVLRGAEALLNNDTLLAVVLEMNGSGARYGIDEKEIDELMVRHGFVARSYDPRERKLTPVPNPNPSGNRIYVRNPADVEQRLRSAPRFSLAGGTSL